jgi:hypothetical protein
MNQWEVFVMDMSRAGRGQGPGAVDPHAESGPPQVHLQARQVPGLVQSRQASGSPAGAHGTRSIERGEILDQGDRGNPAPAGQVRLIREARERRWRRGASADSCRMMTYRDLRAFLDDLGSELLRVSAPLDPKFEVAGVLREAAALGRPVLFEQVPDRPGVRIAGNLLASRRLAAKALGTSEDKLFEVYAERGARGLAPVIAAEVPVQESRASRSARCRRAAAAADPSRQ